MKLTFVEIAGFRGFKDKTRFDMPGGFVVLTGRNGVGKSTVLMESIFCLQYFPLRKYSKISIDHFVGCEKVPPFAKRTSQSLLL